MVNTRLVPETLLTLKLVFQWYRVFLKSINQGQGVSNPSNNNQVDQVALQKDVNKVQLGWFQ